MAESNYERGRRKEYKAIDTLRENLYEACRNASSHGLWDVSAIGHGKVRFIQVKYTKKARYSEDANCKRFRRLRIPVAVDQQRLDEFVVRLSGLELPDDVKTALVAELLACLDRTLITKELWVYRYGKAGVEIIQLDKEEEDGR